jgi:hypothetical protein
MIAEPLVLCDIAQDQVLLASTVLGEIRAIGPDGVVKWISVAPRFRHVHVSEEMIQGVPMVMSEIPVGGYQRLESIARLSDDTALAQVLDLEMIGEELKTRGVHSYAISFRSGEGAYLGTSLPLVLTTHGGMVWSYLTLVDT